jgi:hypothetical protein
MNITLKKGVFYKKKGGLGGIGWLNNQSTTTSIATSFLRLMISQGAL